MENYPPGVYPSDFDAPQERTYIVEISGFVEVTAFDREDAVDVARDQILDAKLEFKA